MQRDHRQPPPTTVSSLFHIFVRIDLSISFLWMFDGFWLHLGSMFAHVDIILHSFFRHRFRIEFPLYADRRVDQRILGDTCSTAGRTWFKHIQHFPINFVFVYICCQFWHRIGDNCWLTFINAHDISALIFVQIGE